MRGGGDGGDPPSLFFPLFLSLIGKAGLPDTAFFFSSSFRVVTLAFFFFLDPENIFTIISIYFLNPWRMRLIANNYIYLFS